MLRSLLAALVPLAALVGCLAAANSLHAASPEPAGKSQAALAAAAAANKFCFLLFYKEGNPATQTAAKIVAQGVAKRSQQASYAFVQVGDPAEQAVVQRFDVARAPMPFLLAVAPNGAISCIFPKDFQESDLDSAFVTPAMTRCMKSIQAGKFVLLCVQPAGPPQTPPAAVTGFISDPHYSQRSAVLTLRLDDPAEARFLSDLKIDPAKTTDTTIVFIAPPGVMIGKYASNTTKAKLASDLHAAGKCCDDPNCKHHHK